MSKSRYCFFAKRDCPSGLFEKSTFSVANLSHSLLCSYSNCKNYYLLDDQKKEKILLIGGKNFSLNLPLTLVLSIKEPQCLLFCNVVACPTTQREYLYDIKK